MKNWYTTREGANLQHKSQPISEGKRIFLTEAQAKLHGDAIDSVEAPKSADESAIKSEYDEWLKTNPQVSSSKPEPTENKEKSNAKAK